VRSRVGANETDLTVSPSSRVDEKPVKAPKLLGFVKGRYAKLRNHAIWRRFYVKMKVLKSRELD
jgi:hypothetical protein